MTALPEGLSAGTWNIDPSHSEVSFSVRHAGISKTRGKFEEFSGTATLGEELESTTLTATIKAASINTNSADRDAHVKGADFFDVEQFPEITFTSTKITHSEDDEWDIEGELTLHGVTKPVTLETEFNGGAVDPFGLTRFGASAETTISRKEFGLEWNAPLAAGGVLVGDKVSITLEVEFTKAQ